MHRGRIGTLVVCLAVAGTGITVVRADDRPPTRVRVGNAGTAKALTRSLEAAATHLASPRCQSLLNHSTRESRPPHAWISAGSRAAPRAVPVASTPPPAPPGA